MLPKVCASNSQADQKLNYFKNLSIYFYCYINSQYLLTSPFFINIDNRQIPSRSKIRLICNTFPRLRYFFYSLLIVVFKLIHMHFVPTWQYKVSPRDTCTRVSWSCDCRPFQSNYEPCHWFIILF